MNLQITDISFRYGRRRPPVLRDFSLDISLGGVYGLLGPNGAGKSTLLYLIAGALTPENGAISYDSVSTRRRLPQTLSNIFLVPEEVALPAMSLDKFVALNAPFYPDFDRDLLHHALDVFGIKDIERIDSLSMGQKKKVFLSFAFACRTLVLLLDEPTNGLDIPGKAAFRSLVAEVMTDDRIFIISTHQVRDLDRILDHVLIMDAQSLKFSRSIPEIQDHITFLSGVRVVPPGALAAIPTVGGFDAMVASEGEGDTEVNLELLFDAVLKNSDAVNILFNHNS